MIAGEDKFREVTEGLLDQLREMYGDELVEIDEVLVVVATHNGPNVEAGGEEQNLLYRCTSARIYIQLGLLEHTKNAIDRMMRVLR